MSDFLYTELLELRLNQRLSGRPTYYNGLFQIPSLSQIMELVKNNYANTGVVRGMYPELKHPSYHYSLGFEMDDMLLAELENGGFLVNNSPNQILKQVVPVVIQCFEAETLQRLRPKTDLPLVYLIQPDPSLSQYGTPWSLEFLDNISSFANAVSPEKSFIGEMPYDIGKKCVENAHEKGLAVVPWTFRADQGILPKFDGNFHKELMYFYGCLGVDQVFIEFPDRAREVIDTYLRVYDNHYSCDELLELTATNF